MISLGVVNEMASAEGMYRVECLVSKSALWPRGVKGMSLCMIGRKFGKCVSPVIPEIS